jgi:AraC family transcriptional regulator
MPNEEKPAITTLLCSALSNPMMIQPATPQLITELNAAAFGVEEVVMPAHFHMRGHTHEQPHLCVVLDGAFAESGHTLSKGMLRLSPAGDAHDIDFLSAQTRCFLITFNNEFAQDAPVPVAPTFQNATLALPVIEQLRHDLSHATVVAAELLVLEAFARVTLGTATSRRDAPPAWLVRVRQALDDQPFNPPSTDLLAREAGLHPVYVARAFRAWYGCSLATYSRLLRLDGAIRLMLETKEPLVRIAATAGFADQSHLTRAVRHRTGLTPRAVRASKVARVQDFRALIG